MADEHREAITRALQADLPMYVLRRDERRGLTMYAGLWVSDCLPSACMGARVRLWWSAGGDDDASPDGLKVVLATTVGALPVDGPMSTQPMSTPLGSLRWTVLQLQAITPNDSAWMDLKQTLRIEIATINRPRQAPCHDRVVYNSTQQTHNIRTVQDTEFLTEYTIQRVDTNDVDTSTERPMQSLFRDRLEYRVARGRANDARPVPELRVYLERRIPKHQHTSQRLHHETGLEREGNLYAAVQTWRTWLVLKEH